MVYLTGVLLAVAAIQPSSFPVDQGQTDIRWSSGAADCAAAAQPPLQVRAYGHHTYILRQNPCAHFEANFIYLLIGTEQALLIDTGAIADRDQMPLAETVHGLLSEHGDPPLVVAHTHGHQDHRLGDAQFAALPSARIIPTEIDDIQAFFGIDQWPTGIGSVDLGGRIVEVLPAPGHAPDHILFYDRRTALLFSGDFLLPGRLLIDDPIAYRTSAARVADHFTQRPVRHVLGGHVELDARGSLYPRRAHHHPDERPLQLPKEALLGLPAALADFNGFYARYPDYALSNPMRNLAAAAAAAAALVMAIGSWAGWRWLRRRRRRRAPGHP